MGNISQNPNSNPVANANTTCCENSSKLLLVSASYLNCNLSRNSCCCGYGTGNQYCQGSADVISHGTCRGRDPKDASSFLSSVGTCIDIADRNCLLAQNSWSQGDEYCSATA